MATEPVEKLSQVLSDLQELSDSGSVSRQIDVLREVQSQMQTQLKLHDAQIAALREVIELLSGRNKS